MTWSGDAGPWGPGPMDACVQTWNNYSYYGYNIPVVYSSGTPTADAGYLGQIRFGGSGNYRTAMHEASHWMGTGTTGEWDLHQRWGTWNGTYTTNLRRAYDGPGERQFIYGAHYGPQGANYDSEGVQGPQMVGIIGAFRRDQNLQFGDQTIGIAPDRYRLRNRVSVKTLDNLGATAEGAQVLQNETLSGVGQEWDVNLILGTRHFTLRNVSNDKYLDSLGSATDGSPVAMTSLAGGTPTDSQLWEIVPTDSFFFKIINKANGKALDNLGASANGSGVAQWTAANNFSWNQHWTFAHPLAQTAPPAGVISQGCWVASSSTDANHYDTKGNNGVSGDRWTASSGSFPQWWQVDLGSVQPMTKVATEWFPGAVFQYRIEVSDNGSNFTVAADRTNNTSSGTTVDPVSVSGRFVRVVMTGTTTPNWAAIMECRVYNEAQPMQQLSQFRPVTASSEQPGNLAVNATDVDPIFTRWCSASSGYPAWWQVDLGTSQQVSKAVIQWFDDDNRFYQYRVEGSNDGTNFITLVDRTGNTTPSVTTDSFSGVARWVRVTVTGGSSTYPSIYEAQIYGALTPQTPSAPQSVAATAAGSQINLSWATSFGATGYSVKRATSSGGPYTTIATPTSTSFSDTAVAAGIPYYYVIMASNSAGESPDSTESIVVVGAELHAYLPFDETSGTVAGDLGGFARNGTLLNGPLWSAGNAGNAVDLDGTNDHVALPAGVVSALNDFTMSAWVNPDVINNWARILDIGTGTSAYMFLCPSSGSGTLRFSITNSGGGGEQQLNGPALAAGVWTHVAVTLSGNTGTLYVNGVAVSTNNAMTLRPSNLGNTTNNWIGRSQYPDPYFNGRVDDLRIYNRALDVNEVGKLRGALIATAPSSLIAQTDDNEVSLNWSLSLGATSYQLKRTTTSGGPYTTIATLNAGGYTDTTSVNGMTYYYVVSAVNAAGQSASSAEATATTIPLAPVITSGASANGTAGVVFSYQIIASNGPTSYGATGLPSGLNVNMSSGLIDGTPNAAGTFAATVSATNAGGTGSAALTITVLPAIPAAPVGLSATGGSTAVALSWTASSGATSYNVKRAAVSGGPYTTLANTSTTAYTDSGLPGGATYFYVVTALNAGGESANSAQASATTLTPPPAPWEGADIGTVGVAGSAGYNAGTYTVSGSGTDIWGTEDGFQFVSQNLSGDGEIRARVTSQSNTDPWAKAGVMIRGGSTSGAVNALVAVTPSNGFTFQSRNTASGGSTFLAGPALNAAPNNWVRLVRSGTLFTAYVSADGIAWTQVGTTTLTMPGNASVGLAVTSHNNSVLSIATFDNVSITPYPLPWLTADVGTTGLLGSAEYFGGAHTLKGAGTFGGTADGFRYVYQTLSADGSIVARVRTLQDSGTNARVGIMIRDTLASNSRMAALTVTGSGAWRWQRRTLTGGTVTTTNSSAGTAPNLWMRLVRSGSTVTASRSTNGTTWTTISSVTVTMASNCYVGLAVASGSTTTLNTSTMDNLTVVP